MTLKFDWEEFSRQDALDYVAALMGGDFEQAVNLTNQLLENPSHYTGIQALALAKKLAAYRFKIGAEAEKYKLIASKTASPRDKLIKGTCIMAFNAIEEMIMCLKAVGRSERELLNEN